MNKTLVIAPHPDDETLGCGGTLLRAAAEGEQIHWLIMTTMRPGEAFSQETVNQRKSEISKVKEMMNFSSIYQLEFFTTELDTYPLSDVIRSVASTIQNIAPDTIYLPHKGDAHSDHLVTFNAAKACTKWFRFPSVKRVYCYETVSETDAAISKDDQFFPNRFVDITKYVDKKIEIFQTYESEVGVQPFPRSPEIIRSLAAFRGSQSGVMYSEAFSVLKEVI